MPTSTLAQGEQLDLKEEDVVKISGQVQVKGIRMNLSTSRDQIEHVESRKSARMSNGIGSDKVVQLMILGFTLYLGCSRCMSQLWVSEISWKNWFTVILYGFSACHTALRESDGDYADAYSSRFNTIYFFFMQLLFSALFAPHSVVLNSALAYSIRDSGLISKVPFQLAGVVALDSNSDTNLLALEALALNYILLYGLYNVSQLKSLDRTECNMFSLLCTNLLILIESDSIFFQVLRTCLASFIILVFVTSFVSVALQRIGTNKLLRSFVLLPIIVMGFPILVQNTLVIQNLSPLEWLFTYIGSSVMRLKILAIWLGSAILLLPSVFTLKSNWSLNTSRKVWHFAILPLLIPAITMDSNFVKISLSGTVVLFLMVEYIRYLHLYPVGQYLDRHLRSFADFRDEKGPIIISYIYFIIGISLPFLMNGSIIGIVSLGVGDSLASVFGKKYGKHKWPRTCKTLEGTLAFIIATVVTTYAVKRFLHFFTDVSYYNLGIVCLIAGILEGNSTLNDNLLIPGFMLILLELVKE